MGKLVRDRIPEMVRDAGGHIETRPLDDRDYERALRIKLVEEANEAAATPDGAALLDELADVAEVLHELVRAAGFTSADLRTRVARKAETHGPFERRLFSTTYRTPSSDRGSSDDD